MTRIERNIERMIERLETYKDQESQEFYKNELKKLEDALNKLK